MTGTKLWRIRMRRSAAWIVLGTMLLGGRCAGEELVRFQKTQIHMGMSFGIVLYAPDEATANRAFTACFDRIEALNAIFSDYDPKSELNRACDQAPTAVPVAVSSELTEVLAFAQQLSAKSGGAFDVTVAPLTKLWRRARRNFQLPAPERLEKARDAVGYQNLVVDAANQTIQLRRAGMRIDLGAIAPGYAADESIQILANMGIRRALVNASGDITVAEPPPGEQGWRIGIAPLAPKGPPSRFVVVSNASVSTSGDAFQFLEINGKRYSHIVDPKTGYGLTTRSSVTVIAKSGMETDALATAVTVLGPEQGLELVENMPHAAALIVAAEDKPSGSSPQVYFSKRFPDYELRKQDASGNREADAPPASPLRAP